MPTAKVDARDLNQRVRFERTVRVRDAGGGYSETWSDLGKRWAKVDPLSGRERLMADQTEAPANYRVTLRRWPDVLPSDRMVWITDGGEVPMQIRFIALPPRPERFMTIDVERGVAT